MWKCACELGIGPGIQIRHIRDVNFANNQNCLLSSVEFILLNRLPTPCLLSPHRTPWNFLTLSLTMGYLWRKYWSKLCNVNCWTSWSPNFVDNLLWWSLFYVSFTNVYFLVVIVELCNHIVCTISQQQVCYITSVQMNHRCQNLYYDTWTFKAIILSLLLREDDRYRTQWTRNVQKGIECGKKSKTCLF